MAGKHILYVASLFGLDVRRAISSFTNAPRFLRTMAYYHYAARSGKFPLDLRHIRLALTDFESGAGTISGDYFHQDLWMARKIFAAKPQKHIDIGSRFDGFVAHLLVFMPVEVIDIRPLYSKLDGLSFVQEDATELARYEDNSIESLSSLHAIEHFGLGRYGDPIDPEACFKAMRSLARVLKPGGRLYFSVPIGIERLYFNAHRVFSPMTILDTFHDLELLSFAAVDGNGELCPVAQIEDFSTVRYACGLFEFTKPRAHKVD